MKKSVFVTSIFCLLACVLHAQITTHEQPLGLSLTMQSRTSVQTLPKPDMAKIQAEDEANKAFNIALYMSRNEGRSEEDGEQPKPLRFAYGVPVNFTLTNSGTWHSLPNGDRLWQLKIRIPDALSLHAYYDEFYLPEGAKFFVYSEETKQSIGAITSEFLGGSFDNPIKFTTGLIYGETMVFEYLQPASFQESAIVSISRIDYGYRNVSNPFTETAHDAGRLGNCHVNINCPEGYSWQNQKRAVALVHVITPTGSCWCSGALINNTNNDNTPYFITANHCLEGLDAYGNTDASQFEFYWNYERTGCDNGTPLSSRYTSTVGATVVANNVVADFALLLLSQSGNPINSSVNIDPYFLGWSRSTSAPSSGAGIHHPDGGVKKISLTNDILSSFII